MKTLYQIFAICMMLLISGCYTPEPLTPDATFPLVREGTIAVFNTSVTGTNPVVHDPAFNIATFLFPATYGSSGSLPNDSRFLSGNWEWTESNFPLPDYVTTYSFTEPANSMQVGDFLVDSVSLDAAVPSNSKAILRLKGKFLRLAQIPAQQTEDAERFRNLVISIGKDTVNNPMYKCTVMDSSATMYGDNTVTNLFSIVANNPNGNPTTYTYPSNWPSAKQIGQFMPPFRKLSFGDMTTKTAEFRLGEVFYYRAVNGTAFIVMISNIDQGVLYPNVKRVTFKYAEAFHCTYCTPL